MLRKSISYENLDGEEVTEEFLFHLSKADLIELEFSAGGSLSDKLEKIVQSSDNHAIFKEFKQIVLSAYGKRSEDGKRFIKSPEIRAEFEGTEAFSNLILELLQNESSASQFINGIMPANLDQSQADVVTPDKPAPSVRSDAETEAILKESTPTKPRFLSEKEIIEMDSDELKSGLATGRYKLAG